MNPERTLGPDIVANDYTGWRLYIFAPLIGATIAVMLVGLRGLPTRKNERPPKAEPCRSMTSTVPGR